MLLSKKLHSCLLAGVVTITCASSAHADIAPLVLQLEANEASFQNGDILPLIEGISDSGGDDFISYTSQAWGTASFGLLRTYATATTSGSPSSLITGTAWASALMNDDLIIDAPGLTGQEGHISFSMHVSGSVSAGDEDASASLSTTITASSWVDAQSWTSSLHVGANASDSFSQQATVSLTIIFGTPIHLTLQSESSAHAGRSLLPGDSSAVADFGSTLVWDGFNFVDDSGSNPATGWWVTSSSGTDYSGTMVAPEPTSAALLLGAAGLLGMRRRR